MASSLFRPHRIAHVIGGVFYWNDVIISQVASDVKVPSSGVMSCLP